MIEFKERGFDRTLSFDHRGLTVTEDGREASIALTPEQARELAAYLADWAEQVRRAMRGPEVRT